ncbi:MAG: YwqG family protein [Micrococcales bacterium]|nr:YwqG family protein [Micrococcales bacterium]
MSWLTALFGTKTADPPKDVDFAAAPMPGLLRDDGVAALTNEIAVARPAQDESSVAAALDALVDQTMADYVTLTLTAGPVHLWSSKVGGTPYAQGGAHFPRGRGTFEGQRMHLLAQLNFDELPALPGMPTTGLLQFFVVADERVTQVYGADLAHPTSSDGFRVVYHKRIIKDASLLAKVPPDPRAEPFLPVAGECALTGQIASHAMSATDYRFDERLTALVRSTLHSDDVPQWACAAAARRCGTPNGHQVGGYPGLSPNLDPREHFPGHTTLLFQLGSDCLGDVDIAWGDGGVGAFFIAPDRLAACDFSDVLYTWG